MGVQQAAQPLPRQGSRMRTILGREDVLGPLFIAPAVIVIAVIAFYPILQALIESLQNYNPQIPPPTIKWVGLNNYSSAFQDSVFVGSIWNTVIFTVVSVACELLLGLLFALVLNQKFPGRGLARAAVLVPWAFPTVISALVWRDLLWVNNTGAIPAVLHFFGLVPAGWAPLSSQSTLMMAMIVIDVWKTAPFMALLLLAGLQVIPDDVYEAARVDGANVWQRFFRVTLPLLKPAMLVALLFRALAAWAVFDMFYVVAGNNLQSMATYAFQKVVNSAFLFPVGVAASVLIFVGAIIISVVFIKGFGAQTAS